LDKNDDKIGNIQLAHQTKKLPDPNGKHVFFMDNFYTRHVLAEKLKQMTDGEARIIGTCKMNLVNKVNAVGVKKAIELLADQPHGSWALVRAYNNEPENASIGGKRQRGSRRACRAHLRAHESHQNIIMT
jgi:hypothetical protein